MPGGNWGTAEAHPVIREGVARVLLRISGAAHWVRGMDTDEGDQADAGAIALTVDDARRLRDDLDRAIAALQQGGDRP